RPRRPGRRRRRRRGRRTRWRARRLARRGGAPIRRAARRGRGGPGARGAWAHAAGDRPARRPCNRLRARPAGSSRRRGPRACHRRGLRGRRTLAPGDRRRRLRHAASPRGARGPGARRNAGGSPAAADEPEDRVRRDARCGRTARAPCGARRGGARDARARGRRLPERARGRARGVGAGGSVSFAGRRALVTGGTRGIGLATALGLAESGAAVAVSWAHSPKDAASALATLTARGARAHAVEADVGDPAAVRRMFAEVTESLGGPPDVLVNNAAITEDGLLMMLAEEAWDRVVRTDLTGASLCCRLAL